MTIISLQILVFVLRFSTGGSRGHIWSRFEQCCQEFLSFCFDKIESIHNDISIVSSLGHDCCATFRSSSSGFQCSILTFPAVTFSEKPGNSRRARHLRINLVEAEAAAAASSETTFLSAIRTPALSPSLLRVCCPDAMYNIARARPLASALRAAAVCVLPRV